MTLSKFCDSSNLTCNGCIGSLLFRALDRLVTLLRSTLEGDVGADHGLLANFDLVILGSDRDLLNLSDLDVLSCVLSNTSSSVVSELVSDSSSDVEVDVLLSCVGWNVGSVSSSSDSSSKKSWLMGEYAFGGFGFVAVLGLAVLVG